MKYISKIVIISLLLGMFVDVSVDASSLSWVNSDLQLVSSQVVGQPVAVVCQGSYELRQVDGDESMRNICFSSESYKGIRLGLYFVNATPRYVVSMRYDPAVYPFGGCESYDNCLYMPSTDTLVRREHLINGIVRSLVVYRNFSERLVRHSPSILNGQSFSFDAANPDYTMQSSQGYPWPIVGMGASANGDWLGVQVRERGFILINTQTLEVKRIANQGLQSSTDIAVSNTGDAVAIMSADFGQRVFDVDGDCGDDPGEWEQPLPDSKVCPSRYIYISEYGAVGQTVNHPRFDPSGDLLSFDIATDGGVMSRIQVSRGAQVPQVDYIALGDSFSSGEGEVDDRFYVTGTNEEFNKCHTSYRSYPFLLAYSSVKNVACSGAKIDDIFATTSLYWGQGGRLGIEQQSLTNSQRIEHQQSALETFLPGATHQEKYIERYKPSTVTIGVGGNDAGLMGKLQTCLMPGTCEWASDPSLRQGTSQEIGRLFERLASLYAHLRSLSPKTKFYAVGYPKAIDPIGDCSLTVATMLDYNERVFMDESITYLNQVIQAAALRGGIAYIDIEDSLQGHRMCESGESAINTIRFGEEIAPIKEASWLKVFGSESFHPTPFGHELIGQIVRSQVDSGAYPECSGGGLCGQVVSRPDPATYWQADSGSLDMIQVVSDFFSPGIISSEATSVSAMFPAGTFLPSSVVRLELHSDPSILGDFVADRNGALDVVFNMPMDTSPGYHTVHALGASASDVPLRIYQTVFVDPPNDKVVADGFLNDLFEVLRPTEHAIVGSGSNYELTSKTTPRDLTSLDDLKPAVMGVYQLNQSPQRPDQSSSQLLYFAIASVGLAGTILIVTAAVRLGYTRTNQ